MKLNKITLGFAAIFTAAIMVISAATEVSAQDPRLIGGAGITVFADANFRGTTQTFQYDVSDLRSSGLDNRISSIRVGFGEQWEVCENRNYGGRCIVVSGQESNLRDNGWGDRISSMRRNSGGGGGWNPQRPPSWAVGTWYWLEGYGRTMTIASNGQITLYNNGRTSRGVYNNGAVFVDGVRSPVTRRGNNIRTVNSATGEVSDYSRTNSGGGGGGGNISRPPNWARGTWYWVEGANRRMTINNDGRITLFNQGRTSYGTYYNNTITIDGVTSTITRQGNRIQTYNQATGEYSTYRK